MPPPLPTRPTPRLAIVVSHPTQYYSPWFRWLANRAGVNLRVFYLWDFGVRPTHDPRFQTTVQWDVDLLSVYASEFVPNRSPRPGAESFRGFDNPRLTRQLAAWQPDVVLLFGYAWLSHLRVIGWARLRGIPIIFRGDSHLIGRPAPGLFRRLVLGLLFRQFRAVAAVGAANRRYFAAHGVAADRIFSVPHAVDDALFDPANPATRDEAAALRARLGLRASTRVVLFAGKFTPAKQPAALLTAFLELKPDNAALVLVGDGPEKERLQELARRARPGTVHFLPFANQSEMPARYRLADIFVLPSRGVYETWGLAINEAMHLGVPCLVSDRVGCQEDLVTDGVTGWVFPAEDPARLRAKLAEALAADRAAMQPAIATRIAGYTYARAAAGLVAALETVAPGSG